MLLPNMIQTIKQHHVIGTLLMAFVFAFLSMIHGTSYTIAATCETLAPGTLFKVSGHNAVYLTNESGKRMYFPNSEVYHTWFADFSGVTTISPLCVDEYPAGGGINYRPGSFLVKTTISPSVFAIGPDNKKHKIANEDVAKALYGANWATKVRDLPDVFDANLDLGDEISDTAPHNGQLVQEEGGSKIYWMEDGNLREVDGTLPAPAKLHVRTLSSDVFQANFFGTPISPNNIIADPVQDKSNLVKGETEKKNEILAPPTGSMTFRVRVPADTPADDVIYIHPLGSDGIAMTKNGDVHEVTLLDSDFTFVTRNGYFFANYRYSRNGEGFATADYLTPDTETFFNSDRGHDTIFEDRKTVTDKLTRWRWFPKPTDNTDHLAVLSAEFPDRIGKVTFRSGVGIDTGEHVSDTVVDNTADRLVSKEFNWVTLRPTWVWTQTTPTPKAVQQTSDTLLKKRIAAMKNAGLNVMIMPSICCSIDLNGHDKQWYEAYFDEVSSMVDHYATMAQEEGAGALVYHAPEVGKGNGPNIVSLEHDQMTAMLRAARTTFDEGEVGLAVEPTEDTLTTPATTPTPAYMTWGREVDFYYYLIDTQLSTEEEESVSGMRIGVNQIITAAKDLREYHNRPIWFEIDYPAIKSTWKGRVHHATGNIPDESEEEASLRDHSVSTLHQAEVLDAFLQVINDFNWVVGLFNKQYNYSDFPTLPDSSIRGKTAEDIWSKWNAVIFEE